VNIGLVTGRTGIASKKTKQNKKELELDAQGLEKSTVA
jgi:hypothetical protein